MIEINHQQILKLRTQMEIELAKLRSETDHEMKTKLKEKLTDLNSEMTDKDDDTYTDSMADSDTAIIGIHLQKIDDLEAALLRVDVGEYGYCKDCGEKITFERLNAYPTAKRCITCQRQYEKKHVL